MLAFHGLLDHPLRQLEVSLSAHRVSHRGVQTPAAAHCHQHRIHSLILAVVTGDVIRAEVLFTLKVVMCHCSFNSCNDISATFRAMFPDCGIAKTFTCGATNIWHALDLLHISMSSWWIWYEVQHVIQYHSMSVWTGYHKTSKLTSSSDTGTAIPTRWLYDTLGLSF